MRVTIEFDNGHKFGAILPEDAEISSVLRLIEDTLVANR